MTLEILRDVLGWCTLINIALMLWWVLVILFARDFVYRMHYKWFKLSDESFDRIHYSGMAFYKILIFVFNLVPYLALRIIG
jgi:hypothetical protein